MKKLLLILLFITCKIGFAQSSNKDSINYTDPEGKKQGKWVILNLIKHLPGYRDDQKVEEGKYADSKKTGIWTEWFANGNMKNKLTFENNRPNGYAIMYHENGKISEEGLWKNSRWVGEYKMYYENGTPMQEFKFNPSGKREGAQKYYYENGQTMIEGDWQNGKESGVLKEYYENGDIKSEKAFNDGTLDEANTKNYEPKKPIPAASPEPVEAKATPPIVPSADEKPNIKPFDGEGEHKLYNKNKQLAKDGTFHKSRLIDGKCYIYNGDGILQRIAVYRGGTYIGDAPIEE